MSRKTFIVFGIVVLVLAAVIPWLVFRADGDAARGREKVSANLEQGQSLFETNCGTCHTLYSAGTDGNFGPDLDELLAATGPADGQERRSNRPKAASSTRSKKASTAAARRAGCRRASSPANRPNRSPNSSPTTAGRG